MRRSLSIRRARQAGAVMIELALVTPVIVLLLVGTFRFGFIMMGAGSMDRAAAQMARLAASTATLPEATMLRTMLSEATWQIKPDVSANAEFAINLGRYRYDGTTWQRTELILEPSLSDREAFPVEARLEAVPSLVDPDVTELEPGCAPATEICLTEGFTTPLIGDQLIVLEVWRRNLFGSEALGNSREEGVLYARAVEPVVFNAPEVGAVAEIAPREPALFLFTTGPQAAPADRAAAQAACGAARPTGMTCEREEPVILFPGESLTAAPFPTPAPTPGPPPTPGPTPDWRGGSVVHGWHPGRSRPHPRELAPAWGFLVQRGVAEPEALSCSVINAREWANDKTCGTVAQTADSVSWPDDVTRYDSFWSNAGSDGSFAGETCTSPATGGPVYLGSLSSTDTDPLDGSPVNGTWFSTATPLPRGTDCTTIQLPLLCVCQVGPEPTP